MGFPGLGNIEGQMKRIGLSQKVISATKVTIEREEETIVITSPTVLEMNMRGMISYQTAGTIEIIRKVG
jgi:NACalpha-BTF3-like transcription factor